MLWHLRNREQTLERSALSLASRLRSPRSRFSALKTCSPFFASQSLLRSDIHSGHSNHPRFSFGFLCQFRHLRWLEVHHRRPREPLLAPLVEPQIMPLGDREEPVGLKRILKLLVLARIHAAKM